MNELKRSVFNTTSLLLLIIFSCLVACMPSDKDMTEEVQRMNDRLPQALSDGMTLEKIDFIKEGFVFVITCDEEFVDMKLLDENKGEVKKMMIEYLKSLENEDYQTKGFVDYCKNKKKKLTYKFVGTSSGQEVLCEIHSLEM